MQTDEEVGKITRETPVLVSKALECFIQDLINRTADITRERNSKTISAYHLKLCTKKFDTFDFLGDIVKDVPDVEMDKPERKSGAGRKKSDKKNKDDAGDSDESDEEEEDEDEDEEEDSPKKKKAPPKPAPKKAGGAPRGRKPAAKKDKKIMDVEEDMDEDDEEMDEIPPLANGVAPVIQMQPVIPIIPSSMPMATSIPTLLNKPNNDVEEDYDNF
jgi:hypothetical protein